MKLASFLRSFALPVAVLGAVYLIEKIRPLRASVESKPIRNIRNLLMGSTAAAAVYFLEKPVSERVAHLVKEKNIGLLNLTRFPGWVEIALGVLLLDYTLYLWHVLTHRIPLLWRFHVVHHIDRDLDASTAIRFHFGEIAISVVWRAMQILLIGVSPKSLRLWQTLLLPSVIFHHSNIKLPYWVERFLSKIVVTPRLHGIHHSVAVEETDSNWSSGLSIWDRLHGTFKDIDRHQGVRIGVPTFQMADQTGLTPIMLLPFLEPEKKQLSPREDLDER